MLCDKLENVSTSAVVHDLPASNQGYIHTSHPKPVHCLSGWILGASKRPRAKGKQQGCYMGGAVGVRHAHLPLSAFTHCLVAIKNLLLASGLFRLFVRQSGYAICFCETLLSTLDSHTGSFKVCIVSTVHNSTV